MPIITENQSKNRPYVCYFDNAPQTNVTYSGMSIDTEDCPEGIFFFILGFSTTGSSYNTSFIIQESSNGSTWSDVVSTDTRLMGSYSNITITGNTTENSTKRPSLGIVNSLRYVRLHGTNVNYTAGIIVGCAIKSNEESPTDLTYNGPYAGS